MADVGRRKPIADESLHSFPQNATMLASPTQSAMPEVAHGETKVIQSMPIAWNSEVTEMPAHHRLQPLADFRNRVHTSPQLDLHQLQLGLHARANRLPKHQKPSLLRLPANMLEAEKIEGLRLAQSGALSVGRRVASELDQARLFRVQFQLEFRHAFDEFFPELFGFRLELESKHDVIGIAQDDDISLRSSLSPCLDPEIEDVMEVDVRQQRGDALPPCGEPASTNVRVPFSSTPAFSHFWMSRTTRRSAIRC
jgi:hypothetical protein